MMNSLKPYFTMMVPSGSIGLIILFFFKLYQVIEINFLLLQIRCCIWACLSFWVYQRYVESSLECSLFCIHHDDLSLTCVRWSLNTLSLSSPVTEWSSSRDHSEEVPWTLHWNSDTRSACSALTRDLSTCHEWVSPSHSDTGDTQVLTW